ncbi:hypothetical protein AC629_13590 [Bradyrhizobium sp. NAS80.1]|uniref:hypothetical protein n=1 Tax=Bradyrhizobium sp. NAS80.1 TaxID=1680159 RepID=UPI00095AF147|nr:hypothetical protein [Bradyrhizobium sp. NAS80.1]OKO87569.1 hypothetical protein AC629_13590 [Bradyrhizobium sp. NAS80.1]
MSESIITDFASIGSHLREIEGEPPAPTCKACEDGGWEMYGTGHMDPHFRECSVCGNPKGLPCP